MATGSEARAAAAGILRIVFDAPAVLQRRKPLAALIGLPEMAGSVALLFGRMGQSIWRMRLTRLIAESIYLRDVPRFRNVAILSLLGGFIENGIYAARSWLSYQLVRKWQARLVHHLHDAYFGRSAFYRQQLLPTAVPDSDERICQDVQRSVANLAWMLDEV
eukprot:COSAG04_NODE_4221_length_2223_cov_1.442353_2_plen_161_part_01